MSFKILEKLPFNLFSRCTKQLVVARYREPIYNWVLLVPADVSVKVYLKYGDVEDLTAGVLDLVDEVEPLANIGREGHTYLHHIIHNYPKFSDMTAFVQGTPTHHGYRKSMQKYFELGDPGLHSSFKLASNRRSIQTTFDGDSDNMYNLAHERNPDLPEPTQTFAEWWDKYLTPYDITFPERSDFTYSMGACFSVRKEYLTHYPQQFYRDLQKSLQGVNPIEGHYLERAWPYIFHDKR